MFTGKQFNDSLIRIGSGSQYDHVSILVKYPKSQQVVVFESLAGTGVCRWDWKTLKEKNYWKDNYSKIVYRKLMGVERDEEFWSTFSKFM